MVSQKVKENIFNKYNKGLNYMHVCVFIYMCMCIYNVYKLLYHKQLCQPNKKSTKDLHLEFTKEDRQMAYKVKKKYTTSLVIQDKCIKTQYVTDVHPDTRLR